MMIVIHDRGARKHLAEQADVVQLFSDLVKTLDAVIKRCQRSARRLAGTESDLGSPELPRVAVERDDVDFVGMNLRLLQAKLQRFAGDSGRCGASCEL